MSEEKEIIAETKNYKLCLGDIIDERMPSGLRTVYMIWRKEFNVIEGICSRYGIAIKAMKYLQTLNDLTGPIIGSEIVDPKIEETLIRCEL